MRLAIGAALVLAIAGTASAATTRKVPADYANIQAAEDACVDGDTILVAKGRYILAAQVDFDVPNIKIVGAGAIVDGTSTGGADNIAFYVNASGISITGFKFVNGSNLIYSDGANLKVTKCTFTDPSDSAIYLNTGSGAIVEGCKFFGSESRAIEGYVTNVRISKNSVRSCDDEGFYINGTGARFESNTLLGIGNEGIDNDTAANAVVLKNKISVATADGIEVTGADVVIEGNTIKMCDTDFGINVDGASPLVNKNKVTDTGGGILVVNADNCEVLANKITDVHDGEAGVEVEADNMTVVGNSVLRGVGYSYGFYLYSQTVAGTGLVEKNSCAEMDDAGFYLGNSWFNGVEVRNCTAKNCGIYDSWGFYVQGSTGSTFEGLKATGIDNTGIYQDSGDNNVYTKCAVSGVYGDGFRIYGDNNDFIDCTAAKCGGEGFDNRGGTGGAGVATTLTGGKYRGDRNDVANDTTGGAFIVLVNVDKVTPGTPQSQVD
jgi:hypothetical protein